MDTLQHARPLAWIKFVRGPLSGVPFDIVQPITAIGRYKSNDLSVADRKVSRLHARLLWNDGAWTIEKLSQTSFVTVDQQRIEQSALSHNALVELGEDTAFLFLFAPDDQQAGEVIRQQAFSEGSPVYASVAIAAAAATPIDQRGGIQPLEVVQPQPPPDLPSEQTARSACTEIASLGALGIPLVEIVDS